MQLGLGYQTLIAWKKLLDPKVLWRVYDTYKPHHRGMAYWVRFYGDSSFA
jgi:hypothetical protein